MIRQAYASSLCCHLVQGAQGNGSRHGRRLGQPGGEGGLEQWEMVQDSTIFSFDSIEDLKQKLQPSTHVQLSPEDVMVWQKLMVAIMTVPWPISTEYSEDSRYNTLLQVISRFGALCGMLAVGWLNCCCQPP